MKKENQSNMRRDGPRKSFGNQRSSGRSWSSEPREMHKATCNECNTECEVPFKPTEDKPVYCRDCYRKKNPRF